MQWRSSRQKRVCRSSYGAELSALSDGADALDFVRSVWVGLFGGNLKESARLGPRGVYVTDARDVYDALSRDQPSGGMAEKRLAVEVLILQQNLAEGRNLLRWCSSDQMLADCLTKDMPCDYLLQRLSEGIIRVIEDETMGKKKRDAIKAALAAQPPAPIQELARKAFRRDRLLQQRQQA